MITKLLVGAAIVVSAWLWEQHRRMLPQVPPVPTRTRSAASLATAKSLLQSAVRLGRKSLRDYGTVSPVDNDRLRCSRSSSVKLAAEYTQSFPYEYE